MSSLEDLDRVGNEMFLSGGRRDRHYRRCLEIFERLRPAELQRRQRFVDRATADLGLHADRLSTGGEPSGGFSLDLFPRILRPLEWERIEQGVLQRAHAFNAFIRDIYGSREILRLGTLPPEVVFEDPSFHPELHGAVAAEPGPMVVGAVDLIRTVSGEWQVLENRFSTPTGISYVIQIRRILAQTLPELFENLPVFPVASFAARLSEALSEGTRATGGGQPLVVLLSEGEGGRHFFEESFLARHMGITLARPADLIVREGRVNLRTIDGLLPVDVIYRRMESPALDPVAFAGGQTGIPGLIQCVRRGTVRVVNGLGCAVADNRALLAFSDRIIRYYSGRSPILRTVPTFHGYDRDQVEWVADHLDDPSVMLKTVCHPETLRRTRPEAGRLFDSGRLSSILRSDPRLIVAQKLPEASRIPVYRDRRFALERVAMRVFFILGRRPYVLPGGLTRVLPDGDESLPRGRSAHFLKDTWALSEKQPEVARSGRLEPALATAETPLPSRAAEAFYWMGRYFERGRETARMLNTLAELRWGELVPGERELYAPLLRGVAAATGQKLGGRHRLPRDTAALSRGLLFDAANPASVRACMGWVRWNASGIRSFITPEFWSAVAKIHDWLDSQPGTRLRGTRLREFIEGVVERCDQAYGTGERTLLHDAGWRFLVIGVHQERVLNHLTILSEVLPHIARRQWEHLRDDTDLTALLRLLGALDAYHRKYRSRAYLDRVAQLLWQNPACTASVLFATASILESLRALGRGHADRGHLNGDEITAALEEFHGWLLEIPLEKIFPARTLELDRGITRRNLTIPRTITESERCLGRMRTFFEQLHQQLEDRFFTHHPDTGKERP